MPNKKIGNIPAKPTQQRTKKRPNKKKPVLTTPTVLKIKIPHLKTTSTDVENQQAKETKFTKNNIKIMLANEVIRAQFPKKLKDPMKKIQNDNPNKKTINKNPILNRKHVLRNSVSNLVDNKIDECSTREPVRQRSCKLSTKQTSVKITKNVPEDLDDNIVAAPKQKPVKKKTSKPVKLRRRKAVLQGVAVAAEANVSPDNKEQIIKPKTVTKHKLSVKSKPGPTTRKRKLNGAIIDVKEEDLAKDVPKEEKEISNDIRKDLSSSRSSNMSELSWTKDISSSSTATLVTVSSHDFFRIDKKIPLVKLSNMDCEQKYSQMSKNISDSVCDETNCSKVQSICEKDNKIPCHSLNLSTSSLCDSCSQGVQSPKNVVVLNKLGRTLNKLSSKLKNFDLEVINWIGCTTEKAHNNIDILNDKMIQGGFLKEERDIIVKCKEINRILSNNPNVDAETKIPVTSEVDNIKLPEELVLNKDLQNEESKKAAATTETDPDLNNITSKQNILYEDNDDDDALSLFAESITGIDSSRKNSSVAGTSDFPEVEEYVPAPVMKNTFNSTEITYRPSKIASLDRSDEDNNIRISNFCEKQNADSTSIYKENENNIYNNFVNEDKIGNFSKNITQYNNGIQRNSSLPRLMASIHKPKQGIHSYVFRGVCFFYLISSCKKTVCSFPHSFIEIEEVKNKLALISEHIFIEEYMMVRTWPQLRRKYGKCFVEECMKRELSRFLVEMAIDFVMKAAENSRDDHILKINVVENTLLYLNKVDLNACADLLSYKVENFSRVLLCDFFMTTIAESQNFSQFKTVFINLTEFMCNIQRKFDINAATLILERVSILPYDEGLARAVIKIIKNTETAILSNSMIGKLEMQLMSSNLGLYDELMGLHEKIHTNHSVLANCYDKIPNESTTATKMNNNLVTNNDIRYSPDTTNLDSVNKTLEPIMTRTIDLKKIQPHLNDKMLTTYRGGPKRKYNNWTNRKMYENIRYTQNSQPMMTPKRAAFKQQSDQNLVTRPGKYQRRDGPSYSQGFL